MAPGDVTSTFDRPYRPAPIALANRVGRLLGIGRAPIRVDQVLEKAKKKVGLSDLETIGFANRSE